MKDSKYEEALERAKELHESGNALTKSQMEIVFPELKESEDEELIKYLRHRAEVTAFVNETKDCERWIAYLERQKDYELTEEDRKIIPEALVMLCNDIINHRVHTPISTDEEGARKIKAFLKTFNRRPHKTREEWEGQKPIPANPVGTKKQQPAEWSEDYREEDLRTRFAFYTYKDEDDVLYLSNVFVEETSRNKGFGTKILAAAEKVAETIGAINIRLKVKQNSPANAWYRKHGYGYMAFEGDYDWLEKTLEFLKPVKQEWSEDGERKLNRIYEILGHAADDKGFLTSKRIIGDNEAIELQDFLKSLRPQPHWKPSEEQMEALKETAEWKRYSNPQLFSLYEDLKAL